jgi:hypothetical protein
MHNVVQHRIMGLYHHHLLSNMAQHHVAPLACNARWARLQFMLIFCKRLQTVTCGNVLLARFTIVRLVMLFNSANITNLERFLPLLQQHVTRKWVVHFGYHLHPLQTLLPHTALTLLHFILL